MIEAKQPNKRRRIIEKNAIQLFFWLAICLFLFVSMPDQVLEGLGLGVRDFRNQNVFYLAPLSFLFICIVALGFERSRKKMALQKLGNLTSSEKKILAKYMTENKLSLQLPDTDKSVLELAKSHVIKKQYLTHRAVDLSGAYKMGSWLLEYLNKHPEIVKR